MSSKPESFNPTTLFFYGTLMIPEQLNRVLGREQAHKPNLRKASIPNNNGSDGYKMKMWGPYPVLVKPAAAVSTTSSSQTAQTIIKDNTEKGIKEGEEEGVITGMAYDLESRDDLWKLAYYEGHNYQLMQVDITLEDHEGDKEGKEVIKGGVFAWVGDEGELSEGNLI